MSFPPTSRQLLAFSERLYGFSNIVALSVQGSLRDIYKASIIYFDNTPILPERLRVRKTTTYVETYVDGPLPKPKKTKKSKK